MWKSVLMDGLTMLDNLIVPAEVEEVVTNSKKIKMKTLYGGFF